MALVLRCDGCDGEIPLDTKPTGRLAPAYYCPSCLSAFDAFDAAVDAERARLATEFEAKLTALRDAARGNLRRLPDE